MPFSLSNAIAGAGGAVADIAGKFIETDIAKNAQLDLLRVRADIEKERDARLSEYRTTEHRTNAETDIALMPKKTEAEIAREEAMRPSKMQTKREEADIAVEQKRREPRTLGPGASEVVDGRIVVTNPVDKPQELLDYYKAQANRFNAEADAIRAGVKYRDKGTPKPQLPHLVTETLEDGSSRMVDSNSGAIGTIIPGTPAKPAKSHWFSPDEPGEPAGADNIRWSYNGKVLSGGLADLYPSLRERMGSAATPSSGERSGATIPQAAIDALRADPKLADQFKSHYNADPAKYLSPEKPPTKQETPKPAAEKAYEPPAGSRAAEVVARRRSLINSRMADQDASKQRELDAQSEFDRDRQSMSDADLLNKYNARRDLRTDQAALLFKLRNAPR